nr:hypothetical protein [uncultured Actinotalea sp.]
MTPTASDVVSRSTSASRIASTVTTNPAAVPPTATCPTKNPDVQARNTVAKGRRAPISARIRWKATT